jgi:hypothetical protein
MTGEGTLHRHFASISWLYGPKRQHSSIIFLNHLTRPREGNIGSASPPISWLDDQKETLTQHFPSISWLDDPKGEHWLSISSYSVGEMAIWNTLDDYFHQSVSWIIAYEILEQHFRLLNCLDGENGKHWSGISPQLFG